MIDLIRAEWPAPGNVVALSTTREGGVSEPPFDSLNLGDNSDDERSAVTENRARLQAALELPCEPCWLEQVHGFKVIDVEKDASDRKADASVCHSAGNACAVLTADCLPVLLCDTGGTVVAAAHCGWRGLNSGVLASVVSAMNKKPADIMAWLGPAIGADDYEVGDDVRGAFVSLDESFSRAFRANKNRRWQADLYTIASRQLNSLGIDAVYGGGLSTFAEPDRFFSYRRDGRCGRMASLIWMKERVY